MMIAGSITMGEHLAPRLNGNSWNSLVVQRVPIFRFKCSPR